MITRIEGIVEQGSDNSFVIQIKSKFDSRNGKKLPIASTHEDAPLVLGLLVNFIVAKVNGLVTAFDVCPVCLDDRSLPTTEDVIKQKNDSLLWKTVEAVQNELAIGNGDTENISKHRYIQLLIDALGKKFGFVSEIEKTISNGRGRVDVLLTKNGNTVACEVGLGDPKREVGNIRKCLDAGYDLILSISTKRKILNKIEKLAFTQLDENSFRKVLFLTPEEVVELFKKTEAVEVEKRIRGYKVIVRYKPISKLEQEQKTQQLMGIIVDSMRRRAINSP